MTDRKINVFLVSLIICLIGIPTALTGNPTKPDTGTFAAPLPTPPDKPSLWAYRGTSVGMAMDEARSKLGTAKEKSDTQDFYVYSDEESAQVFYDAEKKIKALTVTFTGKIDDAPSCKAVFGEDTPPKADGGLSKMVRYPKAGYWISYNKIAGANPLVIIAVQGGTKSEFNAGLVLRRRLLVTGSTLRPRPVAFKAAIAAALRKNVWPLLASGKVKPVIHSVFPAPRAAEGHTLMESNQHIGKIVLTW